MSDTEQIDVTEDNSKKKKIFSLGIQTLISLLFVIGILFINDYYALKETIDKYKMLADAFTVVGVLYLCFGILILVSTKGAFDGVTYGMKCAVKSLLPFGKKEHIRYSDFIATRKRSKVNYFTFIIGIILFIVALIFTGLFYTLY